MLTDWGVPDTLFYDADGNLTHRYSGFLHQRFFWNTLSQLDSVQTYNGGVLHNTGTMRYDAWGRRIRHGSLADTLTYLWDGANVFAELDESGALAATYATMPGRLSPHAVTRGATTYYYVHDEAGNVSGLLNPDGASVNRYRYWPFGFPYRQQEFVTNRFRFHGQLQDRESSLVYMRNRYYDIRSRRFISEDPIGLAGGINVYVYAGNDPINGSDPMGLQPPCVSCLIFRLPAIEVLTRRTSRWIDRADAASGNPSSRGGNFGYDDDWAWLRAAWGWYLGGLRESAEEFRQAQAHGRALASAGALAHIGGPGAAANLVQRITPQARRAMAARNVTESMVDVVLRRGEPFWDPKNGVVNFVLRNATARGHDVLVGMRTGVVTTVIKGHDLVVTRFVPWYRW